MKQVAQMQPLESRRLMSVNAFGRETVVSGRSGSYDIAVASDGSYYVAEVSTVRSPSLGRDVNRLNVSYYSPTGRLVGQPVTVSRYIAEGSFVSVAADANGDAVVTYAISGSGATRLWYTQFDNGEVSGNRQFHGESVHAGKANGAAVSMADDGSFFVAYRTLNLTTDVNGDVLTVAHFDGQDVTVNPINVLIPSGSSHRFIRSFDIAARPDGSGAVFYANTRGGASGTAGRVMFGGVDADSTTALRGTIEPANGDAATATSIDVGGDNGFIIGHQASGSWGSNAYYDRYAADGTETDSNYLPKSWSWDGEDVHTHSAAVSLLPDGGFIASYVLVQGNKTALQSTRVHANGDREIDGDKTIANGDVRQTIIGADAKGNAVVGRIAAAPSAGATGPLVLRRLTTGIAFDGRTLFVFGDEQRNNIGVSRWHETQLVYATIENRDGTFLQERLRLSAIGAVYIEGFGDDDVLGLGFDVPSTIVGGEGNDYLAGRGASDVLLGGPGSDSLYGWDGDDVLDGGGNADLLHGWDGNDTLFGGGSNDRLIGGVGHDTFYGGPGRDSADRQGTVEIVDGVELLP